MTALRPSLDNTLLVVQRSRALLELVDLQSGNCSVYSIHKGQARGRAPPGGGGGAPPLCSRVRLHWRPGGTTPVQPCALALAPGAVLGAGAGEGGCVVHAR